jgi:hypothetical protein
MTGFFFVKFESLEIVITHSGKPHTERQSSSRQ